MELSTSAIGIQTRERGTQLAAPDIGAWSQPPSPDGQRLTPAEAAHVVPTGRNRGDVAAVSNIDMTTAGGRLAFHVFGVDEFKRELIRERSRAGGVPQRDLPSAAPSRHCGDAWRWEHVGAAASAVKHVDAAIRAVLVAHSIGNFLSIWIQPAPRDREGDGPHTVQGPGAPTAIFSRSARLVGELYGQWCVPGVGSR